MRSSSRILALFSALILGVFLAACGGGGKTPPPPPGPLTVTTSTTTQATVNVPYSFYLMGSGGTGSYTWAISGGSLPTGLTLNSTTAQIAGTPTAAGVFHFTAKVTDDTSESATADLMINVSGAILTETSLSYFGFGVQPPDVSLGGLIADGARTALYAPWTFWFAAGLLVLLVLAVNLIGDALRDAFDPTSDRGRR